MLLTKKLCVNGRKLLLIVHIGQCRGDPIGFHLQWFLETLVLFSELPFDSFQQFCWWNFWLCTLTHRICLALQISWKTWSSFFPVSRVFYVYWIFPAGKERSFNSSLSSFNVVPERTSNLVDNIKRHDSFKNHFLMPVSDRWRITTAKDGYLKPKTCYFPPFLNMGKNTHSRRVRFLSIIANCSIRQNCTILPSKNFHQQIMANFL